MIRVLPLAALAATACSPTSPTPAPSPSGSPTPLAGGHAAQAAHEVAPAPGDLKTFGDWAVGRDNRQRCTMASLGPEGVDVPEVAMMVALEVGPASAVPLASPHPW